METKRKGRAGLLLLCVPVTAFGQAASPFMTGATALQTNILAWLTPIAIILVMVLGAMAMANRFALIRTMGFRQRVASEVEPCDGVVRWAGGDARREP